MHATRRLLIALLSLALLGGTAACSAGDITGPDANSGHIGSGGQSGHIGSGGLGHIGSGG